MSKALTAFGIFLLFLGCGFKPIYKLSEGNLVSSNYSIEIENKISREILEEVNANTLSDKNQKYKALLNIREDLTPLIINTNGTVAKYRIEIEISYELIEISSNEVITSGKTRGYAQYDVGASEISNEDTRESMTRIATKNALQLMTSRIQSRILN